jgi:PKD repeat protein
MPSNMSAWQLRRMSDGTLYCALTEAMNPSPQRFPGALFKSTDGGDNWTKVNTGQQFAYINGFDVDPADQNKIYVANFQSGGDGLYGLWVTANGGATWTRTLAQGDTYGADVDPELNTRVYATIEQGEDWWPAGGVYMSENSGATWTKLPGFPFERYGPNYVSFDPDGSQNIYVTTFGGGVWKSTVLHAAAPAASFTATPDSGQFPLDVAFDSSPSTGDITTYTWDFGDGEFSHAASPSHTFTSEGTYTVTLKVEGRNGVSMATSSVEAINVDSDGDGLPDWWELQYFGDLDETAAGDPDADGITNIDEYTNGTDPTQADAAAPAVSGLATVPTVIREGVDRQLTLSALANDIATGNSRIAAAEYFINVLGAAGAGTAMHAADGAFDAALESITASVSTSSWTMGTVTLYVRAKDALDQWGDAQSMTVDVVDGTPPAAVATLAVESAMQFEPVASQSWETLGTIGPEEEELVIDLGSSMTIGAVGLTPTAQLALFPMEFTISGSPDNIDWTVLGKAVDFKAKAGQSLWLNAPADYQYIKIAATGRFSRADEHYYVRMADVTAYQTTDSNRLRATWIATADDGSTAASGAASEYDIRYGSVPITPLGFDSAAQAADGVPVPGVKGTVEEADFSVGALNGTVYVALKVVDEVPNWSSISNVASADVQVTGLRSFAPADEVSIAPDPLSQFTYIRGVDIKSASIVFSDRPDFPAKPIKSGGITSKTIRFPLKPLVSWWKPSLGQWKSIKALANNSGTVYWRLEGRNNEYVNIAGPARAILFDAGTLTDLTVMNSHDLAGDEALWPLAVSAPLFNWTDSTVRMRYYFVDVSTDVTIPIGDKKKTVVLGGSGALGGPYRATNSEWKKIRTLARSSSGVLYWRVRVKDADKVFTYASAVKTLIVDPGAWVLDAIDMNDANPYINWTHTAEGYAGYRLQFCADALFENEPGNVLVVPARSLTATEYILTAAEKTAIINFATKKGVATLHWRVRAEDADKAFIAFSDSATVDMP